MSKSSVTPKILFTTELSEQHRERLNSFGLETHSIPFISFDYVDAEHWLHEIPKKYDAWVFTSKRAVKAIKPQLNSLSLPDKIFVVGEKTARKLEQLSLSPITPEQYNLDALAQLMNDYELNHIIHFCGNLKSGNLSELLDDKSVKVTSIEVYQTHYSSKQVNPSGFDAFVFMSPSAVHSFHQENKTEKNSVVFSIGPSTSKALEEHGITNYKMAEKSTIESLIEKIKNHYH